jgi:hypothetical protein
MHPSTSKPTNQPATANNFPSNSKISSMSILDSGIHAYDLPASPILTIR